MNYEIPKIEFPSEVEISTQLIPEERSVIIDTHNRTSKTDTTARGFHEKSEKNKKTNQGGSYRRELAKKYKKPKTRGDKNFNKNLRKK
jgi:ATP-dependent RNA helicase RhlE